MKTLRINLILVPMALLMASSCVSTRKYTQAQSELKKYKDQASNLEQKNSMLQKSNDDLTKQLASVNCEQ